MKKYNQKLLWISITALALTACGGSKNNNNNNNDSTSSIDDNDNSAVHKHEYSILVAQKNTSTLSLLEEGELEALDDAAAGNGATLVLSDSGAYAATFTNNTVNFVHGLHEEAHVLDYSLTGIKVITTDGHFAVLDTGTTTFIEYDELGNDTPATEDTSALSVTETYPALMIDEEHELVMVFDGTDAKFYEDTTEKDSFTCATPTSHGQTDKLVVISCGAGALALIIEENTAGHTFKSSELTLDGTSSKYIWRAEGHVIVGFEPDTSNYAIVEFDGISPEVAQGSDTSTSAIERTICDIKLDSEEQDVLVLGAGDTTNAGDKLVVLNHEGKTLKDVTLNELSNTACNGLIMASASNRAVIINNGAQKAYDIDAHQGDSYHIHSEYDLLVGDITDVVIFHGKDEDEDGHDH